MSLRLAVFSLFAASSALAHCQLAWPYPLHSTLNPATPEAIKDYSMTSPLPLVYDGTYPCKGFINSPSSGMDSVDTYAAGSTMNYTIVGTATHGGGSCQISMSYDQGATWSVIFSQIGGCPVDDMTTSITIPSAASSGEALFAWSWFNLQGNREMYQNCAVVTITNGGAGLDSSTYPTPFVANAGVNDCKTIENTAVVFPNPGPNVRYGGAYKDTKPTTPAGFTGSNCVGPGAGSSNSSASGSSSSDVQPVAASAKSSPATAATSTGAADARTTLWQGSPSNPSSAVTAQDVSPSDSSPSPVTTGQAKTCNRKRKRSSSFAGSEKRHERLARRSDEEARDDVDRVAAGKAEHVARA